MTRQVAVQWRLAPADDLAVTAVPVPLRPEPEHEFDAVLAGAQRGDTWALTSLYTAHSGRIWAYLSAHEMDDAAEHTSEVFLRVLHRLDDFAGSEAHFRTWLFTVAHRLVDEERRLRDRRQRGVSHRAPEPESDAGADGHTDGDTDGDTAGERGLAGAIDAITPALSRDERDVVMLRLVGDLALEDIACVLDKRLATVNALQRRAVSNVLRHFEQVATA